MTPDVDDLIKKVNTLTLDKNRLKQRLAQLGGNNGSHRFDSNSIQLSSQSNSAARQNSHDDLYAQGSPNSNSTNSPNKSQTGQSRDQQADRPLKQASNSTSSTATTNHTIAGIECATSCEEDLLFMNELYRKRLDDYGQKWDFVQSKCCALLSELNALQKHYALALKEKLELEEKYREKCDEFDTIKGELQTVVVNYETQLSAMSEHLSMIAGQVSQADDLA